MKATIFKYAAETLINLLILFSRNCYNTLLFSEQNWRWIKIVQISTSKFSSNLSNMNQKFLENKKMNSFHCVRPFRPIAAQTSPKTGKTGSVHFLHATPDRTQAATWAWAGKAGRPRAPAWAASPAQASGAVGADRTAARRLRVNKTCPRPRSANPSGHSHSLSLSLRLTALSSLLP